MREVVVAGVGMTRFGRFPDKGFVEHGVTAVRNALEDAGLSWPNMQEVYCGASGLAMFAGNRVGHELGLTGVPIVNVDNASASGTSAFRQAYLAVAEERCDIAMAMGVGKIGRQMIAAAGVDEIEQKTYLAQAYGNAMTIFALLAQRRMHVYGTEPTVFARIAVKSHQFAAMNPYAQYQKEVTLEEVLASRMIADPLTLQMCCPTGDGGAAAIVTTRDVAERLGRHPIVRVTTSVMQGEVFQQENAWGEGTLTRITADKAYESAGMGPEDFDLVQVHDATANEELEYYEALGLCKEGEGDRLVLDGDVGPGGKIPVNTDGGLISRGHPLGPTGLAQIWETVLQLRGEAGPRQVHDAKTGLVQIIGAGTVCFIHILQR